MTHDVLYEPAATDGDPPLKSAAGKLALKRALATIGASTVGAYGLLAVLSYNPADPSFNVATDAAATNLLGAPGAAFADLAVQSLGAVAPLAMGVLCAGGVMRMAARRLTAPLPSARLAAGAGGVALLTGLAALVPAPGAWPLAAGFGGALGDGLAGIVQGSLDAVGAPVPTALAGLLLLAGASIGLGFAFRVKRSTLAAAAALAGRAVTNAAGRAAAYPTDRHARMALDQRAAPAPQAYAPDLAEEEEDWREPAVAAPKPRTPAPHLLDDDFDEVPPLRAFTPEPTPAPRAATARANALPIRDGAAPSRPRPPQPDPSAPRRRGAAQPELPLSLPREFVLPHLSLLSPPRPRAAQADGAALHAMSRRLAAVLADFNVQGEIIAARPGPVVTLFELEPAPGVKSSRVIGLADDIARSMSATAARVAVIPGRNAIGIELPNPKRETVYLRALLGSNAFVGNQGALPLALGETIEGEPFAADLAKMPHLLIAGTTGSGKSVGINAMILSLLYRLTPEECKFIMIDPKMLELSVYQGIPHLMAPVVTEPKKAVVALKWTVREMEERYRRMSKLGVRNIQGYNDRVQEALESGEPLERSVHAGFDPETGEPIYETRSLPLEKMPFIVVIIDEVADLMLVAGKEIEAAVQRLAQMARAAGIHLVMATQRPSVDVITGIIKANFPTRISYSVTSKIDSRTILGEQGAEQLLGMGDLLYMAGGGKIQRLHGPFVHDDDVGKVVDWLKAQGQPTYRADVLEDPDAADEDDAPLPDPGGDGGDLYERAVAIVLRDQKATTSYLQRRLQIGYNRAASLIERMENDGIVSSPNAAGKREILGGGVNDD